jgi:hypothetical protein
MNMMRVDFGEIKKIFDGTPHALEKLCQKI